MRDSHPLVLAAPLAALLAALAAPGCRSPEERLAATFESARQAVGAVRPAADLSGARAEIWTPAGSAEARAAEEERFLSLAEARRVLGAWTPALLALGVTGRGSIDALTREILDPDGPSLQGIALPSLSKVLVRAEAAGELAVVAHELGHLATARMGYVRKERLSLGAPVPGPTDPAWVDLDALIACWILCEGEAQATAWAAVAGRRLGADRAFFAHPQSVDLARAATKLVGPATIEYPDGTSFRFEPDRTYLLPGSLTGVLTYLAYEGSLTAIASYREGGEPLEDTLRRMWSATPLTTREVLLPGRARAPSPLAARARDRLRGLRGAGVTGATRLGAVLLHELAAAAGHLLEPDASRLAAALDDDLVLRLGDGGLLWVTDWTDEAAAEGFEGLHRGILDRRGPAHRVSRSGRRVASAVGTTGERSAELLAVLDGKK